MVRLAPMKNLPDSGINPENGGCYAAPAQLNRSGAQALLQERAAAKKVHGVSIMCGHEGLNTLLGSLRQRRSTFQSLQFLFDQGGYAVLGQIYASRADTQGPGDFSH
jgi:hypothetical protein